MDRAKIKNIVTEEINKYDPIGLFPHAPSDEYSLEIREILEFIYSNEPLNKQMLGEAIYNVFVKEFSDVYKGTLDTCVLVASNIIDRA